MICMPSEVQGGGSVAWAYLNHWLSVYWDTWCSRPSAGMHEIGHNLGLDHSNGNGEEYGDQSCMVRNNFMTIV